MGDGYGWGEGEVRGGCEDRSRRRVRAGGNTPARRCFYVGDPLSLEHEGQCLTIYLPYTLKMYAQAKLVLINNRCELANKNKDKLYCLVCASSENPGCWQRR